MQPVSSVRHRDDSYIRDFDGDPPSPTQSPPPPASRGVDAHVDRGLNDAILYVGMNEDSAGAELGALGPNVTAVLGHAGAKVDTKFGKFDLTDDAQVKDFAAKFVAYYGLSPDVQNKLEAVLSNTEPDGRDELARIALYMGRAESGKGTMPSRLVLSGHSAGGAMWGDNAGHFSLDSIRELGEMFPTAAKNVEDIHFAGCFTYRPLQEERGAWRQSFPSLKTMWGYDHFSAHAPVGDLAAWQAATLGRGQISEATVRAHPGAIAWSEGVGFVDDGVDLAKLQRAKVEADARFDDYVSGKTQVSDPHEARIHDDYATYQRLAARGDKTAAQRADQLLRIRFYEKSVRGEFAKRYGNEVGEAFRSLGLPAPDFSKLSRSEALAAIEQFRNAAGAPPRSDVAEAWTTLDRFRSLNPSFVKTDWIY